MLIVICPNCGRHVEICQEFLGRQVGCVNCRHVYILSLQYHDMRYKQLVIFNTALLCLIIIGMFFKIEGDYRFVGNRVKAASKAVEKKYDEIFRKDNPSDELLFFDFDCAYGTKTDKLKRTHPIVLPEHRGRIVKWGGEIVEIAAVKNHPYGNFYVKFRQGQTSTSDVTVYFRDDQTKSLEGLHTGHYKKYQGVIVSAGYGNTDHILRQGKILD